MLLLKRAHSPISIAITTEVVRIIFGRPQAICVGDLFTRTHTIIVILNLVEEHDRLAKGKRGLTFLLITREVWDAVKDRNIPVDVISIDLGKPFNKASHLGIKLKLGSFCIH